ERGRRLTRRRRRLSAQRNGRKRDEHGEYSRFARHTVDYTGRGVYKLNNYTKGFVVLWGTSGLYTQEMALPIPRVQQALKEEGVDGWLLYDFHGSNPIATRL